MTGRSSQVARGLNTIAANIVKNQDALGAYGITVEDANGNLKSTYDVLSELKPKWDEMEDSERVALGTLLAGKNQYKVLASVMSNFSTATEATTAALNSSGSAARENAKYLESIESKINAVYAAFQRMSTAVVDSDLVKGILDIVKGMAEFGATDFGAAVTQFVLLSGLSWGGLQLLGQSILPGIIKSFETFAALKAGATITELASEGGKVATTAGKLGVILGASLPYILAVVAGIVALVAIIKAAKKAYDEANPTVEQATINMKNAQQAEKQAQDEYEKTTKKLEELNATPFENRTSEIQAEIDELETLVEYYQTLLGLRGKEASEATSKYIASVEKNGFNSGQYQGSKSYLGSTGYETNAELDLITQLTEKYSSLTAAVRAAATAEYELSGTIVDITDTASAQKELENLGWTFDELSISTKSVQQNLTHVYDAFVKGESITPSILDTYEDLTSLSETYVEALQRQKENGEKLTQEQEDFITVYNNVIEAYENYISTQAEEQETTKQEITSRLEAASALSAYAQALINAANAYQIFKDRLSETGDYDDAFKGFSSILSEVISEFDAGQIGSQAFLTGLELLTGQTMTSAEAVEYMNTHLDTLKLLFGDAESGGVGLLTALEDLGYASIDADGNLQITIDDFGKLAGELGISEEGLYSLIEALRVMGVNFEYNVEDILGNIEGLGEGITSVQDGITHVDFAEFVTQAQKLGMTNEEIKTYQQLLEHAANTKLDNVTEGLSLLATNTDKDTDAVTDLDGALDDVAGFDASSTVAGLNNIGSAAKSAAGDVGILQGRLDGLSAPTVNAEGTSYAKEGPSLVNEEGPELIQSGDKAYIAGGGYPTVVQLHAGDKVYTAEETESILGKKKLNSSIQAHGGGTNKKIGISTTGIGGASTTIKKEVLSGLNKAKKNGDKNNKTTTTTTKAPDPKEEFDAWLKAKKHALAMDEITEEEYYSQLAQMNDKYFKGKKEYQDEYWKYQEQIYSWEKKQEEERIKEAERLAEELRKAYKNEFDSWLKAQDHALAMDEITQEEYYEALEAMNDQYFKDKEEYQEEYWKYEEKIYAWRKKQEEEEAKAQEQALKDQIELEKKLNDLAKAKASRVKVFQDGQFRYVSDRDALAKAQEALSGYAEGTTSAVGGLSLVGEHGAEMRVLNKGDGILPSNITKNLWAWGSINPNSFNKGSSEIYNFDINNISLPNVQDANNFVDGLKSFALQYAMQRGI